MVIRMKTKVNWFNSIFIFLFHVLGSLAVIFYFYKFGVNWYLIILGFVFYILTGISITAGYHRLFSHRAYEASPILEYFYLIFGAAAYQNSALKWCYDHRIHHRYVDGKDDPYNVNRGFFHSHIGWVLFDEPRKEFPQYNRDLLKNKRIVWQDKHYLAISTLTSLGLPTFIGALFGHALGGFLVAGLARITVVHHATFFINSLCHMWGKQTYTDKNTAKDNAILAFFTYGEGFHNFHHLFSKDYRNGIRWFHFDPTKWTIKMTEKLGLARKLTVTPREKIILAKVAMKEKLLSQSNGELCFNFADELESLKQQLSNSIENWQKLKVQYLKALNDFKVEKSWEAKRNLVQLRIKLRMAKKTYMLNYKVWLKQYKYTLKYATPALV